jgi:hypothetical protein
MEVYVSNDASEVIPKAEYVMTVGREKLLYGESDDGWANFGLHDGKQLWSSRPGVINKLLNKQIVNVTLIDSNGSKYGACMTLEAAASIVPNGYKWVRDIKNDEPTYIII